MSEPNRGRDDDGLGEESSETIEVVGADEEVETVVVISDADGDERVTQSLCCSPGPNIIKLILV